MIIVVLISARGVVEKISKLTDLGITKSVLNATNHLRSSICVLIVYLSTVFVACQIEEIIAKSVTINLLEVAQSADSDATDLNALST